MRAGAIGIIPQTNVDLVIRDVVIQSTVTHSDIRAHLASVLIALATYTFTKINYDERMVFDHEMSELILEIIRKNHLLVQSLLKEESDIDNFSEKTRQFFECAGIIAQFLKENPSAPRITEVYHVIIQLISDCASKYKEELKGPETGTKNFALEAPITAFVTAIFFGHNFPDAVMNAINLGGDTDTVASMVGQMVGAYQGFNPEWWDVQRDRGSLKIVPEHERAEQETGIPLEWYLPLMVKWQLYHRTMRLAGISNYKMPQLFNVSGDNDDRHFRELLDFESLWTQEEREKKKLVQEYFGKISKYKIEQLPREIRGIHRSL